MTLESNIPIGSVKLERHGLQWVRMGVPAERSKLNSQTAWQVMDDCQQIIDSEFTVTSRWPDGSAKWVLIDALIEKDGPVYLRSSEEFSDLGLHRASKGPSGLMVESNGVIDVEGVFSVLPVIFLNPDKQIALEFESQTKLGSAFTEQCKVYYRHTDFPLLSIELTVSYNTRTREANIYTTVYNHEASEHRDGCWDLGDPNSLILESLMLVVTYKSNPDQVELMGSDEGRTDIRYAISDRLVVHQYGSGGEHWDSPVHLDKIGNIDVKARGYSIEDATTGILQENNRVEPQVYVQSKDQSLYFRPEQFWQNAPAMLVVTSRDLQWQLFPEPTELQPGESKTWTLTVKPEPGNAHFCPNADYVNQCGVLTGISIVGRNDFSEILDTGIEGKTSFFQKREQCDEYGWRHFGDLYADHEALYTEPGSGIFVSHYNNQYDPLMGFQLCFMSNGDLAWAELAQALKQHIYDIDLYKTDRDKAEYNHGLFWHTDHYLPALTATHRTYSAQHTSAYDGHQGGGGPGGQHCYTTGLTLHYFLTGDAQSREAVLNLMGWVRCFYNGPDSLLSRFYRFLSIDLKPGQMTNIGIVPAGYKYPLDRGTANYLNALIDGYQISSESALLDEMFEVIRQTLSPFDDLFARQLEDIENAWFYIVFLQALARYLLLKEQLNQADDAYGYSRQAFNHYANWVQQHEKPYLTAPENLEFPNDTWAAQDIRKANVLYYAAYFDPDHSAMHLQRAEFFWHYCVDHLSVSEERSTTRVLAILMQNQGVREWQKEVGTSAFSIPDFQPEQYSQIGSWRRLLRDSWHIVQRFSWHTEWHWLKTRLAR